MSNPSLLRTPLFDVHVALGGKMVPFAGWEMALQYPDGILKEHEANRKGCSIFDCSHMGEFLIEGDAAACGIADPRALHLALGLGIQGQPRPAAGGRGRDGPAVQVGAVLAGAGGQQQQ